MMSFVPTCNSALADYRLLQKHYVMGEDLLEERRFVVGGAAIHVTSTIPMTIASTNTGTITNYITITLTISMPVMQCHKSSKTAGTMWSRTTSMASARSRSL